MLTKLSENHVETHVLVSKDLKRMQAMVETSELRCAECIKMIQTIAANFLKPYRKSLENMLAGATEAKRKFYKHSLFNVKKRKLIAIFGLFLATRRKSRRDRRMALKIQTTHRF